MHYRPTLQLGIAAVLLLSVAVHADCPPGDLNGDCRVDTADLALLAQQWLTGPNTPADLNRDGHVDGADLARLGSHWRQQDCPIVINEVLAHAHGAASDWIEFYNTGNIPVHVGGWFLSDNRDDLFQYEIAPGTTIEPHGYLVLYEKIHFANPFDPGMHTPFAFTENGEAAYLYTGDDAAFPDYLIEQSFGASETGYPFGRYRTSTGRYDFVTMSEPTPGAANAYPRVGPVVINEIMYHPAPDAQRPSGPGGDAEYVELLNISDDPVTLFDSDMMKPWRLTDDVGIDFWLPVDVPVTLAPGESLVLARDLGAMPGYDLPPGVWMLPWGPGKLKNGGGTLRLLKPGDVDKDGKRYWIEVDHVDYSDGSHGEGFPGAIDPWPADADGSGASLSRLSPTRYGNDPNNWQAALPTPGSVND